MKTNNINRTLMAIAIAFGVQTTASAQLGGLLNKAKKAVKEKAENVISSQKKKVKQQVEDTKDEVAAQATGASAAAVVGAEPECPELMSIDRYSHPDNRLYEKLYSFRFATADEAKDFGAKMTARYLWGKKVKENMGHSGKPIAYDSKLDLKLDNEAVMYEKFYGMINQLLSLYAPVQMKLDQSVGAWYYEGRATFNTQMSQIGVPSSEKGIKTSNPASARIRFEMQNNKYVFIDGSHNPRFLEDDEMQVAQNELNFVTNLAHMLQPIAEANEQQYMARYQAALAFVGGLKQALAGNSIDNLEFKPMPKAGGLNGALKAQALAIAKKQNANVVDVVITRDAWDVKRNALGQPLHRVAYGYRIVSTKHGKRAVSCSWAQDHQGGGKYGALRHFGVGTESFFVK